MFLTTVLIVFSDVSYNGGLVNYQFSNDTSSVLPSVLGIPLREIATDGNKG